MNGQDCVNIIAAIAASQIGILGALGVLWARVHGNSQRIGEMAAKGSAPPS